MEVCANYQGKWKMAQITWMRVFKRKVRSETREKKHMIVGL